MPAAWLNAVSCFDKIRQRRVIVHARASPQLPIHSSSAPRLPGVLLLHLSPGLPEPVVRRGIQHLSGPHECGRDHQSHGQRYPPAFLLLSPPLLGDHLRQHRVFTADSLHFVRRAEHSPDVGDGQTPPGRRCGRSGCHPRDPLSALSVVLAGGADVRAGHLPLPAIHVSATAHHRRGRAEGGFVGGICTDQRGRRLHSLLRLLCAGFPESVLPVLVVSVGQEVCASAGPHW